MPADRLVRLNLYFPKFVAETIDKLAEADLLSRSQVIQRALGLAQVCSDARKSGHYVVIMEERPEKGIVVTAP